MNVKNSVIELVGNTPLFEMHHIEEKFQLKAHLFAKLEYLNPTGSVKDRAAKEMIENAEREGKLNKDSVIVEPTSGNTGIGLASIGVAKGYRVIIVMPDSMSIERRKLMKAYGAELVLSEGKLGMKGAVEKAQELVKEIPNAFIPNQFDNQANARAHYKTTGKEIYEDLDGNVDVFVAGVGTGGTLTGTGKYLKEKNSNIHIVAVEPATSPVLSKGVAGPHKIQGIGANFVPGILDLELVDEIVTVENEDAFNYGAMIGKEEGFLCGISSGAALYAAIQQASLEENEGKNIVVVFPDSGDRYLSTALFGE